jgi:D-alanyl-D-alanine carboxypeptidase
MSIVSARSILSHRLWSPAARAALGAGLVLAVLAAGPSAPRAGGSTAAAATQGLPACSAPSQTAPLTISPAGQMVANNPGVQATFQALAANLPTYRNENELASVTVVVVAGQDVIYAQSFGCADLTAQSPATPSTVFEIGSATKMFTVVMMMQLRDAGKLNLDDPVNQYVPEATWQGPDGEPATATFAQLASHTSGLPRDLNLENFPMDLAQFWQDVGQLKAVSAPGTMPLYSNVGYAILGQVLAQIAGQSYEDYVVEHILRPLGMNNSGFPTSAMTPPGGATGYDHISGGQGVVAPYLVLGPYNPAAGMISTPLDMAQFIKLQFSGGNAVLSEASIRQMQQQVTPAGVPGYAGFGLGWELLAPVQGLNLIGKDGELDGFQSQILFASGTTLGVFVIANTASPSNPQQPEQMTFVASQVLVPIVKAVQ